jgi:hypothetical protein
MRATFRRWRTKFRFRCIRLTTRFLYWQMDKAGMPRPGVTVRPMRIRLPRSVRPFVRR